MNKIITIDFETYYSREYSLSKMTTERYVNDSRFEVIGVSVKRSGLPAEWFSGTFAETKEFLQSFDLENHYVLAHNAAFDGAILGWRFGIHPKFLLDTLSMAKPSVGVKVGGSLAKLSEHFGLGVKGKEVLNALGKRRQDFEPIELHKYAEYCCNDVELTYKLYHCLCPYSTPQEQYIIDLLLKMYTDPVLMLDKDVLEAHLSSIQARKEKLLASVECSKDELMSNPKFAAVLESFGVTPPTKISKTTGKATFAFAKTDEGMKALLNHPNPDVQALVATRLGVKSTLEETRTLSFLEIAKTGMIPIPLGYYNAHTGRAGGWDGINMQNMPRGGNLRRSVIAPPGHVLIAGDSAQIEARVVAWWAGEDWLVEAFANGADIYSLFASDIYGMEVNRKLKVINEKGEEEFPHFQMGFVGKTAILGLGFQMGAERFVGQLKVFGVDMPLLEGKRIVDLYRAKNQKIKKLWADAEKAIEAMAAGREFYLGEGIRLKCDKDGVHLPNGMLQQYPDLRRKVGEDGSVAWVYRGRYEEQYIYGGKLVENIVQALARIVVFNQMCMIRQRLDEMDRVEPGRRYRVVMTVHDEVVAVVPIDQGMVCAQLFNNTMRRVPKWAVGLPISCEIESGPNYADTKVVKFA